MNPIWLAELLRINFLIFFYVHRLSTVRCSDSKEKNLTHNTSDNGFTRQKQTYSSVNIHFHKGPRQKRPDKEIISEIYYMTLLPSYKLFCFTEWWNYIPSAWKGFRHREAFFKRSSSPLLALQKQYQSSLSFFFFFLAVLLVSSVK